jgi:hypothetical protein
MSDEPTLEEDRRELSVFRKVLDGIIEERDYQRKRWEPDHDKSHTPEEWLLILSVYMGKSAMATKMYRGKTDIENLKKRLTQMAAICMAAIESLEDSSLSDNSVEQ